MEQLELAYLDARSDANINQLLLIPCVILDFLCIHPFRDGNGRMSRLLSLLLLGCWTLLRTGWRRLTAK